MNTVTISVVMDAEGDYRLLCAILFTTEAQRAQSFFFFAHRETTMGKNNLPHFVEDLPYVIIIMKACT
jgi:hypothetical protein